MEESSLAQDLPTERPPCGASPLLDDLRAAGEDAQITVIKVRHRGCDTLCALTQGRTRYTDRGKLANTSHRIYSTLVRFCKANAVNGPTVHAPPQMPPPRTLPLKLAFIIRR